MRKIIVLILAVAICISIAGCQGGKGKIELDTSAEFAIMANQEIVKTYTLEEIRELGEVTFTAIKDTSKTEPTEYEYTGVPLINLYNDASVEVDGNSVVVNSAVDGYEIALKGYEVLNSENVYIVYIRDGKAIGSEDQGGTGPFVIIIEKDQYANRWCKYAISSGVDK